VRRLAGPLVALVLISSAVPASGAPARRAPRPLDLLWQVETVDGAEVSTQQADAPVNPASVVKVATSLWALERLGPEFRFETRVFARGTVDRSRGLLDGDLVVHGSGDPDFGPGNAMLIADSLVRLGVARVQGRLLVNPSFWIGSEDGSNGTLTDADARGVRMAGRLRQALDPQRWGRAQRAAWRELAPARGLDPARPPRVAVTGGVGVDSERSGELLLVHRSGPLADTLRRFNCYSNNDIERLGTILGPVEELVGLIRVRCEAPREAVQFATTSGLGTNRLTPRLVVRLLREFRATALRAGLTVDSLLPVAGCDPGTVTGFFPTLAGGPGAGAVIGKTGTLTATDGGVSVLAGYASTGEGDLIFCVVVPQAAGRLRRARRAEEQWMLDLLASHGGPRPNLCGTPLVGADRIAEVIVVASPPALVTAASGAD
jgi:D-alanyl-D-alanine carboxypeptidase/D-alanyl-D-alanine-endopeptidase (penicillin-binding protein 4)